MKKEIKIALGIIFIAAIIIAEQTVMQMRSGTPVREKYFGVNVAGPEFEIAHYPAEHYAGYRYFKDQGLTIIRIPFSWERMQPQPEQPLKTDEVAKLSAMVTAAEKAGQKSIIEPHNFARYYGEPMTTADTQRFADLWRRLAQTYKEQQGIWGYELMNEPHDLQGGCETWRQLSQAAIDAIREEDRTHYILIPGYSWQNAEDWQQQSGCLADLHDPQNKLIYAAHEYFDEDKSGKYESACTDTTIGKNRAQPFLTWLKDNNVIGMFTEYGIPPDSCWMETLDMFMQSIYTDPNIIGGLYWAAGPSWGKYPLSIEPRDGQDRPQMEIVKKYPSTAK